MDFTTSHVTNDLDLFTEEYFLNECVSGVDPDIAQELLRLIDFKSFQEDLFLNYFDVETTDDGNYLISPMY